MLRATLRGLLAHRLRLALSTLAVVLGVAFVSGSYIFTDTLERTFTDLFKGVSADVSVLPVSAIDEGAFGPGGGAAQPLTVPDSLVDQVRGIEGVQAVEGAVGRPGVYVLDADGEVVTTGGRAPGLGVNWSGTPGISVSTIVAGTPPRGPREVVIDSTTAERIGAEPGDAIELVLPQGRREVTVAGVFRFGETGGLAGATVVAFESSTAQDLLLEPGRWSQIDIAVEDGVDRATVKQAVAEAVGSDYRVVTQEETVAESTAALQDALSFFNYFLLGFAGISLFIGSFLILNTFSMLVAQRMREFALLRAIGATRRQVTRSVLVEAALVGILGSALGLLLGLGLGVALRLVFARFGLVISPQLSLAPRTVLVAVAVGVGVTVVSAWLPARRGSRVPPVAALRDAATQADRPRAIRAVLGSVLAVAAAAGVARGLMLEDADQRAAWVALSGLGALLAVVVLAPFITTIAGRSIGAALPAVAGVTGRLAQQNALRSPRRTAATASAMLIGMTLVSLIAIVSASTKASVNDVIDRTFGADLIVGTSTFQPFDASIAREVSEVADVRAVVRQVQVRADVDGEASRQTFFAGPIDRVLNLQVGDGSIDALGPRDAIITTERAERTGVALGDPLEVTFADGSTTTVSVAAVVEPTVVLEDDLLLPLASYEDVVGPAPDSLLYIDLVDGADAEAARTRIEAVTEVNPLISVWDQTQLKQQNSQQFDQLLAIIYGLLGLSVVIAILGVVNTLVLSVAERVREIGLLRAVGMQRRGIRRMIRWESVFISVLGTSLGISLGVAVGVALQRALEPSGVTELVIPWTQVLLFLVAAAVVGVLAAIGPARRAAHLDVLDAIATE